MILPEKQLGNTMLEVLSRRGFDVRDIELQPESNNSIQQGGLSFYVMKDDTRVEGPWCDASFKVTKRKTYEGRDLAAEALPGEAADQRHRVRRARGDGGKLPRARPAEGHSSCGPKPRLRRRRERPDARLDSQHVRSRSPVPHRLARARWPQEPRGHSRRLPTLPAGRWAQVARSLPLRVADGACGFRERLDFACGVNLRDGRAIETSRRAALVPRGAAAADVRRRRHSTTTTTRRAAGQHLSDAGLLGPSDSQPSGEQS